MNDKLQIAILDFYNGYPNEGMRCIKNICDAFIDKISPSSHYEVFDVRKKGDLPDLNQFNAIIGTGGPGSPLLSGDSWELAFTQLMDQVFARNRQKPYSVQVILICHSFQLLVQHLKLAEVNKRNSISFGVMHVHKTHEGLSEPLFEVLPDPFFILDSREYQVVNPAKENFKSGTHQILALEKIRPLVNYERAIMAIRFSDEVIGTQFHPEADAEGILKYLNDDNKRQLIINEFGQEKYEHMLRQLPDPDKIILTEKTILPTFLRKSLENLAVSNARDLKT